jgi:adenosine 3'-phospho 5'-phosphosulfate transporter B3
MFFSGELIPAVEHASTHTAILPAICTAAIFGYLSVSFILLLIRHYGATNTEVGGGCVQLCVCKLCVCVCVHPEIFARLSFLHVFFTGW